MRQTTRSRSTTPRGGAYKKLVLRGGKLVGAVLYGDVADGPWFVELIREGRDIEPIRERLMFGRACAELCEAPAPKAAVAPGLSAELFAEEAA